MFDSLGKMINMWIFGTLIFIPLGIWKFIEIVIWLVQHVKIVP